MFIKRTKLVDIIVLSFTAIQITTKKPTMATSTRSDFISKKKTRHKLTLQRPKKAGTTVTKAGGTTKKSKQKALANELRKLQEADTETTDALPHTQKHDAHINKVCKSFASTLSTMGHKWVNLLKEKEFELPNGKKVMVPTIFIDIGGERTPAKMQIANKAVVDWMRTIKKQKITKRDKFTWYQPVTQNQMLRTFIAHMSKTFFWPFDLDDFNFSGGVIAEMKKMYEQRYKLYGKVSIRYAKMKTKRQKLILTYCFFFSSLAMQCQM